MILTYKFTNSTISINDYLKNNLKISSRLFYKLIKNNRIYLNGSVIDTRVFPNKGDILTIDLEYDEDNENIVATKMNLDIVYEDDALIAVNKPAGMPTHPSMAHYDNSLSNGIKYYFETINLHKKIRPVNRLDIDTSGIVIFAKNEYVQEDLIRQMADNSFHKEYLALCEGIFENKFGTINKPIARKENSIIERTISDSGKNAITKYEILKEFNNFSLVKCILLTGRTHQIRVHMSYIGHPILGDTLYGNKSSIVDRQALHCYSISFLHPVNKNNILVSCFPKDKKFVNLINL